MVEKSVDPFFCSFLSNLPLGLDPNSFRENEWIGLLHYFLWFCEVKICQMFHHKYLFLEFYATIFKMISGLKFNILSRISFFFFFSAPFILSIWKKSENVFKMPNEKRRHRWSQHTTVQIISFWLYDGAKVTHIQ